MEHEQAECDGVVSTCGKLLLGYLDRVRTAMGNDLMADVDIADAVRRAFQQCRIPRR